MLAKCSLTATDTRMVHEGVMCYAGLHSRISDVERRHLARR